MTYKNPIISGFYPDPSICKASGRYYLVCSSFEYFPGVPLFESTDLVNWRQIGNVLTNDSQLPLGSAYSSGGIYAPTIRENNGRFYMVTTNVSAGGNFYVYTDDIYGEWSEPVYVNQSGIDPTIYFEDGKAFFISNGNDESRGGLAGIQMSEIDIKTGGNLTPPQYIWYGSGGRYVEAPHIYKINGRYYLMTAEGGTEYGHMVTYAVSDSLWGEYKTAPNNPVLTNRNLGGYSLQAVGHGDLTHDDNGNYWMVHLGFRTPGGYVNYHHLGRETFLTPVTFNADGTFTAGENGTASLEVTTDRLPEKLVQKPVYADKNFIYLRNPISANYIITDEKITLHGTNVTLDDVGSPTFIGLRQKEFDAKISANVKLLSDGNAGITLYMNENHHYDLELEKTANGICVCTLLNIGDVKDYYKKCVEIDADNANLRIEATDHLYRFFVNDECIAKAQTRYLSTEVAGGFTGVIIGLYAENGDAEFTEFTISY
ncbi:MAG: glycoside hydrolase family 43 protein [Ruminococcus sp.]|jgi:alpha-N-arabinofuranosidase|nr:glycoside hydrolase family 43 protein [Ruminococcus sp.]